MIKDLAMGSQGRHHVSSSQDDRSYGPLTISANVRISWSGVMKADWTKNLSLHLA